MTGPIQQLRTENPGSFSPVIALVFIVAVVTKLPGLDSWWCLDDWGQLARGAGFLDPGDSISSRWLSQHLYWSLTWPLFGLNTVPHVVVRILLHGMAAVTVARIAKHAGLGITGILVSGLLFAASPIAFTVIYWASGIQELLAGTLALLAIERWFANGRTAVFFPTLFGVCSILAKESGLGLPVLFAVVLVWSRFRSGQWVLRRWIPVVTLLLVGVIESFLVLRNFGTGLQDPYRMGGLLVVLGNMGKFGWWLLTQGPVFTGQVTWSLAAVGIAFFALWALWAIMAFRRHNHLPVMTLVAALLGLAPALVLVHQARPYMGYLAMASLALLVGSLLPRKWSAGPLTSLILAALAVSWGLWGMSVRLDNADEYGMPMDPIVRAVFASQTASQEIFNNLPESKPKIGFTLVVYQPPLRAKDIEKANQLGVEVVKETDCFAALSGKVGLSVLSGRGNGGHWVNSLLDVHEGEDVFCETTSGLKYWGGSRDALLYASLLDVVIGNKVRASAQLQLAANIDDNLEGFVFQEGVLGIPISDLKLKSARYLGDLVTPGMLSSQGQGAEMNEYDFFLRLLARISESEFPPGEKVYQKKSP